MRDLRSLQGEYKQCALCTDVQDDCQWEAREDYRKPLSRKEVQALVTRMQGLEKNLRDLGHDPGTPTEDPYAAHEAAVRRKAPDQQSSTSDTKDELALDHLVCPPSPFALMCRWSEKTEIYTFMVPLLLSDISANTPN